LQLDEGEKAFVEQLRHGKRHLHWLGTRVLLRTMLRTDEYIDCKIDAHGKPYLVNLPYHISLSHSFDYAAVMISKKAPVGIDIEQIQQKVERIAPRFLNAGRDWPLSNRMSNMVKAFTPAGALKKPYINATAKKRFHLPIILACSHLILPEGSIQAQLQKGHVNLDYTVQYLQYEDYMVGYVKGA
jgi:4'-phosphopantetheinyl transferase